MDLSRLIDALKKRAAGAVEAGRNFVSANPSPAIAAQKYIAPKIQNAADKFGSFVQESIRPPVSPIPTKPSLSNAIRNISGSTAKQVISDTPRIIGGMLDVSPPSQLGKYLTSGLQGKYTAPNPREQLSSAFNALRGVGYVAAPASVAIGGVTNVGFQGVSNLRNKRPFLENYPETFAKGVSQSAPLIGLSVANPLFRGELAKKYTSAISQRSLPVRTGMSMVREGSENAVQGAVEDLPEGKTRLQHITDQALFGALFGGVLQGSKDVGSLSRSKVLDSLREAFSKADPKRFEGKMTIDNGRVVPMSKFASVIDIQSPDQKLKVDQTIPKTGQQTTEALEGLPQQNPKRPISSSFPDLLRNTSETIPQKSQSMSSQVPSEAIIPRKQVEASDLNVKRLELDTEQQARVTESQVKELRDVLGDKEVQRIAKGAGIDTKTHTTDQQAKKIAEQLNVRRQVVELENQRTELLKSGGTSEQLEELTKQIAATSRVSREQGTEIARQLAARRIIANEINTPMQRVFQLMDQAGINPDVYAKDAAALDFTNGKAVVDFYRKYVPGKFKNWLDLTRYNSMLSSPNTFINNFFSNLQGSAVIAPVEKTLTGTIDALKSALTGSKRKYYVGEGAAYLKGYVGSVQKAKDNFANVMTGKNLNANPDFRQIPLTQSGSKMRPVENILKFPMTLLEATDQFFTTLTKGGVEDSLNYRAAKGGKTGDIGIASQAEAAKRLFRSGLGDNQGSNVLNALDTVANTIQKYKNSNNPVISTISKFTLPFVQTPTNILKQGVEYSPVGITTMWGSTNKTEQLSKTIMGTSIATGVAMMLGSDRLTWAEPTSQKQKAAFRAAGMQPYSVKVGNNWVSYSKLHPAIAFNLALVSAVKNAEDNKELNESQAQTILKGAAKWLNFFADQSYVKSIGDLVSSTKGDVESPSRLVGNYAQQVIPFRALMGWVARIVDPNQRKVDTDGSLLEQQFEQLKTQIPFVSKSVPARLDQNGQPIPNQNRLLNAFSPNRVTTEDPNKKNEYESLRLKTQIDRKQNAAKDRVQRFIDGETNQDFSDLPPRDAAESVHRIVGDTKKTKEERRALFEKMRPFISEDIAKQLNAIKELEDKGFTLEDRRVILLPEELRARAIHERLQTMTDKNNKLKKLREYQNFGLISDAVARELVRIQKEASK